MEKPSASSTDSALSEQIFITAMTDYQNNRILFHNKHHQVAETMKSLINSLAKDKNLTIPLKVMLIGLDQFMKQYHPNSTKLRALINFLKQKVWWQNSDQSLEFNDFINQQKQSIKYVQNHIERKVIAQENLLFPFTRWFRIIEQAVKTAQTDHAPGTKIPGND